jgi:hypothetical protein
MNSAVLFMFIAVVIIGVILLVVISVTRRPARRLDVAKYQERWMSITSSVGDDTASMQVAILNADKLLDNALRDSGASGSNLGERLKSSGSKFSNLNAVWSAHKLRNRIAHEHDVALNARTTQAALNSFKAALRDLGAL